jgi:hypothetical protein
MEVSNGRFHHGFERNEHDDDEEDDELNDDTRMPTASFDAAQCPNCGSGRYEPFVASDGRAARRCIDCGIVYSAAGA